MLERMKEFIRRKPAVAIGIGLVVILILFFLFTRRGAQRSNIIPAVYPAPTPAAGPTPRANIAPAAGELPNWIEEYSAMQARMTIKMNELQRQLAEQGRNVVIIQDRTETPAPTPTPTVHAARWDANELAMPAIPFVPAMAGLPEIRITQPMPANIARDWEIVRQMETDRRISEAAAATAPGRDTDLINRLRADIARVEAARQTPTAIAYFEQHHGGIEGYLAAQRARLAAALR